MSDNRSVLAVLRLMLLCLLASVGITQAQGVLPPTSTCDPTTSSCIPQNPPFPAGPVSCSPSPGGPTCKAPGPASMDSSSGVNVGAGNPINVITGNKYQHEVDMAALPGELGIEIVRHYNSAFSGLNHSKGIVGRGWKLSYETELYAGSRTVQILQADGARIIFNRDPDDPSQCASANPQNGSIKIIRKKDGDEYIWTWTSGRKLTFDRLGKLVQIAQVTGHFVSLQYDSAGMLLSVADPQGRKLRLHYLNAKDARAGERFRGVQSIDSPMGKFTYEYGSPAPKGASVGKLDLLANLVRVGAPAESGAGKTESAAKTYRTYHYEDPRHPTLLTGISSESVARGGGPVRRRVATYAYDAHGKGTLSVKGEPARLQTDKSGLPLRPAVLVAGSGVEQVTMDRSAGGRTVVANSQGQKTTYLHAVVAGEYRLLEVQGAGCANCVNPNIRYAYDRLGRLTSASRLSPDGRVMQTFKNELDDRGRTVRLTRVDYENGRPGAPQLVERYEYASGFSAAPTLVVRPSVVPGHEFAKSVTYNDRGQPLSETERGWSPAFDGRSAARPIERTTRYSYHMINGKSLLAGIDGPRPNGKTQSPADSDLTRIEYDDLGIFPRNIVAPGNEITNVTHNEQGLPIKIARNDGARTVTTEMAYSAQGLLKEARQIGELNNLKPGNSAEQHSGHQKIMRTTAVQYDAAGALFALRFPAFSLDLPGASETWSAEPDSAKAGSIRIVKSPVADAVPSIHFRMGQNGSVADRIVEEVFSGRSAGTKEATAARRWVDDFERLVAVQYWGGGIAHASYKDGSDQFASLTDTAGVVSRFTYNGGGQLETLIRTDLRGDQSERVDYRYHGNWLVEQASYSGAKKDRPDSLIRLDYNALGQVVREYQLSGTVGYSVNHAYDDAGRLNRTWITEHSKSGKNLDLPAILLHYHADPKLGDRIASIQAGEGWFGIRPVISALRWLTPSPSHRSQRNGPIPSIATGWRFGNGLLTEARYDALTTPGEGLAWRIRGYHDGLRAYSVTTDDAGRIHGTQKDGVSMASTGTVAPYLAANQPGNSSARPASAEPAPAAVRTSFDSGARHWPSSETDAAGRLLKYRSARGEFRLAWDSAGRLAKVYRKQAQVATYSYDGMGRRTTKVVDGTPAAGRRFIYSAQQLVAEADLSGTILKQFIYLGSRPVAWIEPAHSLIQRLRQFFFGPKVVYLHTDHRGAITGATDGKQAVVWQREVDPFGNVSMAKSGTAEVEQPLRLVGQYADQETGLHYNLARFYDPESGNFLSPDPAGLDAGELDLYAYAGGDPLNYFDPDGWAKVVYYAITAAADGRTPLGISQGFSKARWAFVITGIKGGAKENVLYDPRGGFVKSAFSTATGDAIGWFNSEEDRLSDPTLLMRQYYGEHVISLNQFTIDNFDNNEALAILAKLGFVNEKPACAAGILPQIKFAAEDPGIDVTTANANGANKQRILVCGAGAANDLSKRRISKYEAAAEINETGMINRDCSNDGCPGIAYYCSETKCFNPVNQILYGAPKTNEPVYTPSYGRSQFIGSTLVGQLSTKSLFTDSERQYLGLTADITGRFAAALARGSATQDAFGNMKAAASHAQANKAWEQLAVADRERFSKATGLGEREYVDMKRMKTTPPRNSKGENLSGDAAQAFVMKAIMSDSVLGPYLMGLFKDFGKFTILARTLMKTNMDDVLKKYPKSTEAELAARVARAHNGGTWKRTLVQLTTSDQNDYVKNFLGQAPYTSKGDWRSLRCVDEMVGYTNNVNAGPVQKDIGGLEMTPLQFPKQDKKAKK